MNRGSRIIVVGSPALGGSGIMAQRIANALARRGYSVRFVSYALPKALSPDVVCVTARPRSHPLSPFPLAQTALAEGLYESCMRERVEVIHAHYATLFGEAAADAVMALSPGRRPRLVLTCHGTDVVNVSSLGEPSLPTLALTAAVLQKADAVTAVSRNLADRIEAAGLVPSGTPVAVVPNFIDAMPGSVTRRGAGAPIRIVHASNFRPVKQPQLLPDIARLVDGAELTLVGAGPLYARTVRSAETLLGASRVRAYGELPQKETLHNIAEADVMLLPSRYESFSLAALEAQACGIPVVGTASGGMREVVRDGTSGFLLHPDAPLGAWADAVRAAISLPCVRREARASAARFSETSVIREYERLYEEGTAPLVGADRPHTGSLWTRCE